MDENRSALFPLYEWLLCAEPRLYNGLISEYADRKLIFFFFVHVLVCRVDI